MKTKEKSGPNKGETISFTPETWVQFKAAYKRAIDAKEEDFTWDGHEFFTGYAKYMIEFYDPQFKSLKKGKA